MSSSPDNESYELLFKLVLVGDTCVGKTNIMKKYITNSFDIGSKSTVGVEFGSKILKIKDKQIKAQIWDTAGQERYKSITSAYYRGAKGAFVVYDITNKNSFQSVDKWIKDLKTNGDEKIIIILIGNKNDLENERQIKKEEGELKAKELEIGFMETSALTGNNVIEAFELLLNEIYEKTPIDENNDDVYENEQHIELNTNDTEKNSYCCS